MLIIFKEKYKTYKMFHVSGETMKMRDVDLSVRNVEMILDKRVLILILTVVGISIILSGCLAYVFSSSLFTVLFALIIGVTTGVLMNYFILTSYKIIKKVNIELSSKEDAEDIHTVMKIK